MQNQGGKRKGTKNKGFCIKHYVTIKKKTKTKTQTQIYKTPLTSYKASWVALASRSVITKSKQNHAEIDVSDYSYFIVRKDQNFVQLQHHEVLPNINNRTDCNFFFP